MVSRQQAVRTKPLVVRRENSINALLDATAEILAESTRIDASLSEISKRAGINSAMIKYYFGNKEGLLLALLERDAEAEMSGLAHLVAMDAPADRKLRIHIEGIINSYFRSPYLNRLIHHLVDRGTKTASDRVTEIFVEPMIQAYRAIVEQGVREGSMKPVDPVLLYFSLVGSADHIFSASYSVPATMGVSQIDEDLKRRYTDHVCQVFVNGLRS